MTTIIFIIVRDILEASGLGRLSPIHNNNHGSHTLSPGDVTKLFAKTNKEDIVAYVEKYKLDFKVCGYEETLKELVELTK